MSCAALKDLNLRLGQRYNLNIQSIEMNQFFGGSTSEQTIGLLVNGRIVGKYTLSNYNPRIYTNQTIEVNYNDIVNFSVQLYAERNWNEIRYYRNNIAEIGTVPANYVGNGSVTGQVYRINYAIYNAY